MDILFENIYQKITDPDFGSDLGGELPIFLQTIPPEEQLEMPEHINRLMSRLNRKNIKSLHIDIYDLSMRILEERRVLDLMISTESKSKRYQMISTLNKVLNVPNVIIPRIKQQIASVNPTFVFISGVGHVYPFLRSHSILNNLDNIGSDVKVIIFFPGDYNNLQLTLFGRIFDENYYRAQKL